MIRKRIPDKYKAKSMLAAAELEINFIKKLEISKESSSVIIRSVYECFRMLGDALMVSRGKEAIGTDHHTEMVNELFTLKVETKRPIQVISSLKQLRHKINYQGYMPSIEETKEALSIVDACFKPILDKIKEEVSK